MSSWPTWALVAVNLWIASIWLTAALSGKIAPSTIAKPHQYASRRDTPFFYWFFFLLLTAIFALPASALANRLFPFVPDLTELVANWPAG